MKRIARDVERLIPPPDGWPLLRGALLGALLGALAAGLFLLGRTQGRQAAEPRWPPTSPGSAVAPGSSQASPL